MHCHCGYTTVALFQVYLQPPLIGKMGVNRSATHDTCTYCRKREYAAAANLARSDWYMD